MKASFIHIADTHLGYEQYGVRERFNDFSRAFWDIIDDALFRVWDHWIADGKRPVVFAVDLADGWVPMPNPARTAARRHSPAAIQTQSRARVRHTRSFRM